MINFSVVLVLWEWLNIVFGVVVIMWAFLSLIIHNNQIQFI